MVYIGSARANELTLEEVLESARQHFPQVAAAMAARDARRGDYLAAQGAFDAQATQSTRQRLSGFWDGKTFESSVTKPLENFGGQVYGGYRISDGEFPIYEDIMFTNSFGELKAGVSLSLLRDREIDARRVKRLNSAIDIRAADLDLLATRLVVQEAAMRAFYSWQATGRQMDIYRTLLALAKDRDQALSRRVAQGDAPEILMVENRQILIRREILLAEAEQRFRDAGTMLSLYLRDDARQPVRVGAERLGAALPEPQIYHADTLLAEALQGLEARPELRLIDARLQAGMNDLKLAQNILKPRLDVDFEVSRDFGDGSITREGTDVILGLKLVIPLQTRLGEGQRARARAEIARMRHERQMQQDRLEVELRMIATALSTSSRLVELAEGELAQARLMVTAEQTRFENGESDFFLLNIREERVADAKVRAIDARLRYAVAEADLFAATLALGALGLEDIDLQG
ncbi:MULTISPECIES: TolC family protein [unclassified Iodidimonas]|jgi:outer membrane protein TolC|uniref:TolC family protein n=1 Tax=unclassified Iodidimonas TaxID=2626145 RepID=UPI00248266BA|nr:MULTISPECIES: TolC family protein [unclassified Iodidimonas]